MFVFLFGCSYFIFIASTVVACSSASTQPETSDYQSRLQTRSDESVTVSTSVLSDNESLAIYGVPLADKNIQPVWITVENNDDIAYWLMSPGLDPNFFPASEAADAFAASAGPETGRELDDAFPALVRRGWRPTEVTWSGSVSKMITSTFSGERYRYAPVSPLYMYGRSQELALQKARNNVHQRNQTVDAIVKKVHLRAAVLSTEDSQQIQGQPVFLVQTGRPVGGRFASFENDHLTLHPDVDEARNLFIQDMLYSGVWQNWDL